MGARKGWQKYLTVASESSWGVTPGAPVYVFLPVSDYGVRAKQQGRRSQSFIGMRGAKGYFNERTNVDGAISGKLLAPWPLAEVTLDKSWGEYVLDWLFDFSNSTTLPSKVAEWHDGQRTLRHNGLRVASAQLSGSIGDGVSWSANLIGSAEDGDFGALQAIPASVPIENEFLMSSAALVIDPAGSPINLCPRDFTLSIENNLTPDYCTGQNPQHLLAGERVTRFVYNDFADDTETGEQVGNLVYEDLAGNNLILRLTLKGHHSGTKSGGSTYATLQIDIPFFMRDIEDPTGGKNDTITVNVGGFCLLGTTDTQEVTFTWGTA